MHRWLNRCARLARSQLRGDFRLGIGLRPRVANSKLSVKKLRIESTSRLLMVVFEEQERT